MPDFPATLTGTLRVQTGEIGGGPITPPPEVWPPPAYPVQPLPPGDPKPPGTIWPPLPPDEIWPPVPPALPAHPIAGRPPHVGGGPVYPPVYPGGGPIVPPVPPPGQLPVEPPEKALILGVVALNNGEVAYRWVVVDLKASVWPPFAPPVATPAGRGGG
jgi:hypothetical protein